MIHDINSLISWLKCVTEYRLAIELAVLVVSTTTSACVLVLLSKILRRLGK